MQGLTWSTNSDFFGWTTEHEPLGVFDLAILPSLQKVNTVSLQDSQPRRGAPPEIIVAFSNDLKLGPPQIIALNLIQKKRWCGLKKGRINQNKRTRMNLKKINILREKKNKNFSNSKLGLRRD